MSSPPRRTTTGAPGSNRGREGSTSRENTTSRTCSALTVTRLTRPSATQARRWCVSSDASICAWMGNRAPVSATTTSPGRPGCGRRTCDPPGAASAEVRSGASGRRAASDRPGRGCVRSGGATVGRGSDGLMMPSAGDGVGSFLPGADGDHLTTGAVDDERRAAAAARADRDAAVAVVRRPGVGAAGGTPSGSSRAAPVGPVEVRGRTAGVPTSDAADAAAPDARDRSSLRPRAISAVVGGSSPSSTARLCAAPLRPSRAARRCARELVMDCTACRQGRAGVDWRASSWWSIRQLQDPHAVHS